MSNTPVLTVDTAAIVANWQLLKARHAGSETAAVVKADAYGLGVKPVAHALATAGCTRFFVATLAEAVELRSCLDVAHIAVFQGILKGEEADYVHHRLIPVMNTVQQLQTWKAVCDYETSALPAAIHVDTAMQRLGLTAREMQRGDVLELARSLKADMLMTHYACASDAYHPLNGIQRDAMQRVSRMLPHLTTCFANSSAHFLDASYHGEITRPGCALYGITPLDENSLNPMYSVVTLTAPILQVRCIDEMGTIGYCATTHVQPPMRTVTVGIGYADGISRQASNQLYAYLEDYRLPLLGRVTMDMLCFDVTHVPESIVESAKTVTLMDTRQTVDDMARMTHTIGYEVLTSLGKRVQRKYV
jgi:alanine racemase